MLVAVLSHDFADGLNTVSFVLKQSKDEAQAKRWLAVDASRHSWGRPSAP